MATIKKSPAKKMQEGGKVKIKVKIKPNRNSDKDKAPLMKYEASKAAKDYALDKASKEAGYEAKGMKMGGKAKKMGMGGMADSYTNYKMGGAVKAKNGKSFPDLNKDGKITKADILKGRGVIAKKGATLKKQAAVAIAMKKAGKAPKKMQYGGAAASMVPPMMKKGGAMKKCKYGCK
jgi:hypothetical protein